MRRYWSVILLGARGVTGKLLALLAALAAVEAALVAGLGLNAAFLAHMLNFSHLSIAFRGAILALTVICCLWGSDLGGGGRCGYTLARLRVGELTVVVLWGLCYALAFLALMGAQLLLILGICRWSAGSDPIPPQSLFLASYQNKLFHGLLPIDDWGVYVRNALYALSLGLCSSMWSFWSRRRGGGWSLYIVALLVVFTFPAEIGSGLDGLFLGALALIFTAVGLFFVRREVRDGED